MQKLKDEINFRYNIVQYKKLTKNFVYNCYERHNVEMLFKVLEDLHVEKSWYESTLGK